MRQFLLGATCGALFVGVLTLLFRQHPSTETEALRSAVNQASQAVASMPNPSANPIQTEHPRDTPRMEPPKPPPLSVSPADQQQVAPGSPSQATTAKPSGSTELIPSISLSAEHARMLSPVLAEDRPPTLQELHMQFATEREDLSWSLEMEQKLNQFLAQSNNSGEFEILTVDCRSTLCEILAFGNLPQSPQRWNSIGSDMGKQPWWSYFKGNSTSSSEKNGRTTIVTILQRERR